MNIVLVLVASLMLVCDNGSAPRSRRYLHIVNVAWEGEVGVMSDESEENRKSYWWRYCREDRKMKKGYSTMLLCPF